MVISKNQVPINEKEKSIGTAESVPLHAANDVDLKTFNSLKSPDYMQGKPISDIKRLFYQKVKLDDETTLDVETIKVPGFIGIADEQQVTNSHGNNVSGHEDIIKFLDRDGLLICTYQHNKDRYGQVIDLSRLPTSPKDCSDLMEVFIKNQGHHSGAIVPAIWKGEVKAFATFNEPDKYHDGMYGDKGFIAVAQRLLFPEFVTKERARAYINSIICWMAAINPFVEFPKNYNGGDPTRVCNRATLKELLKNCIHAALGSIDAIDWLSLPENHTYCAEYIYVCLNTLIYPFNKHGLTLVLDGDEAMAIEALRLQDRQNNRRKNFLSKISRNPMFQRFDIQMPMVPEDLPPLDALMAERGQTIDPDRIPFPPFKLSQILRRAFRTLLPRHQATDRATISKARARWVECLEPLILQQLGLYISPPLIGDRESQEFDTGIFTVSNDDPKLVAVREFMVFIRERLQRDFGNYEEFERAIDKILKKADELVDVNGLKYFVPPRIYVDLGQNDGDSNLPRGWGFRLETVGTLIYRGAIKG